MPFGPASATSGRPKLGGKLRQCRIALIVGTRPEAIKLSPVAHALAELGEPPALLVTGQHPGLELSDHRLEQFDATPLTCAGQPDPILHADLVRVALRRAPALATPELLVVQGDTSSALGGALAARESGVPLAHIEAGLRTFDPELPWPEESNRVQIDRLADLLFAPTEGNAANLRREKVRGQVEVTGNSGVDALAAIVGGLPLAPRRRRWFRRGLRLLVTCHRRENWEQGLDGVAVALRSLAGKGVMSRVVLPPNATVAERMTRLLAGAPGISLAPPLSHSATIEAMREADLVLSDSGGMQEEAPALGVPMLVLRDKTERPEAITSGNAVLAGTEPGRIVKMVERLQKDRSQLASMAIPSLPFGDGHSAPRIARHCLEFLDRQCRRSA